MATHNWKVVEQFFERFGDILASSSDTNFPAINAGNDLRNSYWKANVTGATTLTVDAQTLTTANILCLARHNAPSNWTSVKLESSPDNSAWSTVADPITPQSIKTPGTDGFEAGGDDAADAADYYYWFGNTIDRYWRLNIGGSTIKPEVGVMTIGRAFEYDAVNVGDLVTELIPSRATGRGVGGHVIRERLGRPRFRFTVGIRNGSNEAITQPLGRDAMFGTLFNTRVGNAPMWYIPRDDDVVNTADVEGRAYYVFHVDTWKDAEKFKDLFDWAMTFEEVS